jgi:predicted HNH restriction endonuclease
MDRKRSTQTGALVDFLGERARFTIEHISDNHGRLEQQIWNEFHNDPSELRRLVNSTRAGYQSKSAQPTAGEEADENEFPEGKVLYRMHRARERNAKLVRLAKSRAPKFTVGSPALRVGSISLVATAP